MTANDLTVGEHAVRQNMLFVPRGIFTMGSERFYPEEAPLRRVKVEGFWIDETPITNAQFARFVAETGHITVAEIAPCPKDYPGLLPGMDQAGSLVFQQPADPVGTNDPGEWWHFVFGANWRHPLGPQSDLEGLADHPVVQVAYADAQAYAKWAGKALPTEAEFEFAARGGHDDRDYAWGDELAPEGRMLANYWQGQFPNQNDCLDGWARTSPVRSFPANDLGLYDMIGNVWEWTQDWWAQPAALKKKGGKQNCCSLNNPRGGTLRESFDPDQLHLRIGRKVLKGGSHLCAENHCQRYRPAARHPEMIDTSTAHIGFRCVLRG